jgi:hypothetical protein
VKIQGKLTEVFNIERVLRQGDTLSRILFNIPLEELMRTIEINPTGMVFNRLIRMNESIMKYMEITRNITKTEQDFDNRWKGICSSS